MNNPWTLAALALSCLVVITTLVSVFGLPRQNGRPMPLSNYLLADNSLDSKSIINLLLSGSFGLNALFYAAFLGYSIGLWSLIIQIAWSASFFLLAPYVGSIQRFRSLHEFLGERFGPSTRIIAALCSVGGLIYFVTWEIAISRATLNGLGIDNQLPRSELLILGMILGTLIYTTVGGLGGNARANLIQNILKTVVFGFLTFLLVERLVKTGVSVRAAMFPPAASIANTLGLIGFATNIMFNLLWQFVDSSSWQSFIGGSAAREAELAKSLRSSGVTIFVIPNLLATLLGIALIGTEGIDSNNILVKSLSLLPSVGPLLLFFVFVAVVASVMSLIDGCFLASSYALIIDVLHPNETLASLDKNPQRARRLLITIRVILVVLALAATWGVKYLLDIGNIDLFGLVYVVIIFQVALIGPVLISLLTTRRAIFPVSVAIVLSLAIGFGSSITGTIVGIKWLNDGAGVFAILTSCLFTVLFTRQSTT
ncbi:MAG TPA: hypothetical protein VI306_26240 [Pyrinomonadaceae bacterium]